MIWTALNLTGLAVTVIGAAIGASAVHVNKDRAELLSGSGWGGGNPHLAKELIRTWRRTAQGFAIVATGTVFQAAAIIGPLVCP